VNYFKNKCLVVLYDTNMGVTDPKGHSLYAQACGLSCQMEKKVWIIFPKRWEIER